jgi:hypothetical protein
MRKFSYFLFGISFLIFLAALAVFVLQNRVLEEEDFYASVEISESGAGFDVNDSALTFGKISKFGGSSTRNVVFENGYGFPVRVGVSAEGNIAGILDFEKSVFFNSTESGEIPITALGFESVGDGFYEGIVKLSVKPA